jgi:GntR family transcriptional repressor for pyruvate dehydrogenase complex
MMPSLKPIKPKRISDQVFDQLRELVLRGELKPEQQIMPERELAENLVMVAGPHISTQIAAGG